MTLRRSIAAVLLIAVLPISAMLSWQVYSEVRAGQQRAEDDLARSAAVFAQAVDRELGSSIDALTVLSQSEIFQQGRIAAMGRLLQGRPRRDWDSIFLIDAGGAVVLDTAPRGTSSLPRDAMRELHAQALRRQGPVVSGVTGHPGIAIALTILQPAQTAQPRVRYVLGVRTSDAVWPRIALNANRPEDGEALLADAQGRVIGRSGSELADAEVYSGSATVPIAGWTARVVAPAAPIDAAHRHAIFMALSTYGASLLLGLALAAFVAYRSFVRAPARCDTQR